MTCKTFTCFKKLPPEVQVLVWEAAIRPDRPSLQYFEIRVEEELTPGGPHAWHLLDIPGSNLFEIDGQDLWTTEPQKDDRWESDCQRIRRAKESAYFQDASLWSTC